MLRIRSRRWTAQTRRTAARLAAIEASVTALVDEDLLDLADIFSGNPLTPLSDMATTEMQKRKLSL